MFFQEQLLEQLLFEGREGEHALHSVHKDTIIWQQFAYDNIGISTGAAVNWL